MEAHQDHNLKIALVLPGQEAGSYYLLDGRWKNLSVWKTLAYNLTHDPLCSAYTFSTQLDPAADWQDPGALAAGARGRNQQAMDSLTGDTVTAFYSTSSPEEISDFNYDMTLLAFKRKLDLLGFPYAIGTDYFEPRRIAVCLPAEQLSYDAISSMMTVPTFHPLPIIKQASDRTKKAGIRSFCRRRIPGTGSRSLHPRKQCWPTGIIVSS